MSSASTHTPRPHLATFVDLLTIPEEQRFHEILDGEVIQKAMASGDHGSTQAALVGALLPYFQRRPNGADRPGGWWFATEVEIMLAAHQVVRPDLAGWRRVHHPDRPSGYPLRVRPDWVCEVMADGDARRRDGMQKRRIYADHGVPHYWLVDTERQQLTVLRLAEQGYVELLQASRGDRVRAEPFEALELQVGTLFGDESD